MRSISSYIWAAVAVALAFLMPSSDSLWVDEGQTWLHASAPTFGEMVHNLSQNDASEALMPVSMLVAWVSAQITGFGEWQLRSSNIFWVILAIVAFVRLGALWQRPWAPLLFAVHPFVWYYANEARPYSFQMATTAWMAYAVAKAIAHREIAPSTLWILAISSLVMDAATLFGVLTSGPVLLIVAALAWRQKWKLTPQWKIVGAVWLVLNLILGAYFLWQLSRGAEGARIWKVGLQNIAFMAYELLGFGGFGPGRDELRSLARSGQGGKLVEEVLPALAPIALLCAVYVAWGWALLQQWRAGKRRTEITVFASLPVFGSVMLFTLALVAGFPFWGRHMSPAFPFFCALLVLAFPAAGSEAVATRRKWWIAASIGCALFLASGLQFRFSPRHAKDDYRSACAFAREALAQGKSVWYCGDPTLPRYYKVPVQYDKGNTAEHAMVGILHPTAAWFAGAMPPDYVLVTKADINDVGNQLTPWLAAHNFRPVQTYKAFQVLQRTAEDSP